MKNKRPTLKEKQQNPLCDDLKRRILDLKPKLPKSGITSWFAFMYPEYDTVKGKSKVSMVLQLRATDLEITQKLESLADSITNIDKSLKPK